MSDSKLIIRICCAALFLIGCIFFYDFYENNYLPPQRGFYIISVIDAEQFKDQRDTLRKKNGTETLLLKIKNQLFSGDDQTPLAKNSLNSIPEDQLTTCQAFSEKESATQKNDYYYLDSENSQLHRFRRNVENISSLQTDADGNKYLVFPNGNVNFKRESDASFSIYYTLWVKACELGSKKNITCIKVEENDPRLLALKNAQKEERADDLAYFASLKKKVLPIIYPDANSVTIGRGSVTLYAPIGSTLINSTSKLSSALEENYVPTHNEEWYTLVTNNTSVAGIRAFSTDGSALDYNTLMMKRIPPEHILFQNQNGIIYYHTAYKCIAISHYAFDAKKSKHIIADAYLKITDTTWKTAQNIFATFRTLDPTIRVNLKKLDQKELFKRLILSSEKEFFKVVGEGDIRPNDYKFFTKKYIRSLLIPGVLLKEYPKLVRRSPIAMFHAADVEVFKGDKLSEVNAPKSNSGLWKVVYENNSPNRQILLYQNMENPALFTPIYVYRDNGLTYRISLVEYLGDKETTQVASSAAIRFIRMLKPLHLKNTHTFSNKFIKKHVRAYANAELAMTQNIRKKRLALMSQTSLRDTPTTPSTYLSQKYVHLRGYKLTVAQHLNIMQWRARLNKVNQKIREKLSTKNSWSRALPKQYGVYHIVTDENGTQGLLKNLGVILPLELKKITFKEKPYRFEIVTESGNTRTLMLSAK